MADSGWTLDTLKEHFDALRDADHRFAAERDRRLTEVASERKEALAIKAEADKVALNLAREIQDYKDEKANNLRSQIEGERGQYATKTEIVAVVREFTATVAPLVEYVASQRGSASRSNATTAFLFAVAASFVGVAGVIVAFLK